MSTGRLHAREKVSMEDPAQWKPLEAAVAQACAEWRAANRDGTIGLSLPAYIAQRLRDDKFTDDADAEPVGIERLRQDGPLPEPPARDDEEKA